MAEGPGGGLLVVGGVGHEFEAVEASVVRSGRVGDGLHRLDHKQGLSGEKFTEVVVFIGLDESGDGGVAAFQEIEEGGIFRELIGFVNGFEEAMDEVATIHAESSGEERLGECLQRGAIEARDEIVEVRDGRTHDGGNDERILVVASGDFGEGFASLRRREFAKAAGELEANFRRRIVGERER